jgi:hypothetical protein
MLFAVPPPVTKPTLACGGSCRKLSSHCAATSSTMLAAGDIAQMPAFWSHTEVSQSATVVTGRLPPMTKPK